MDAQQLSDLDDAALLEAGKKKAKELQIDRFIVGMVVGIAIYSLVKNGLGFFTFFPLLYILISMKKTAENKLIKAEIAARNLN